MTLIKKLEAELLQLRETVNRQSLELVERNKELEIEHALEKVRARSMAMRDTKELADVAAVLFNQLTDLGIDHLACGFSLLDNERPFGELWMSHSGGAFPQSFPIDFSASPQLMPVYTAWKEGKPSYINQITGPAYKKHLAYLLNLFGERVEKLLRVLDEKYSLAGQKAPEQLVMHHHFFSSGSLMLQNVNIIEEHELLSRFTRVFEQAYIRFLDLQLAESHAARAEEDLQKLHVEKMRTEMALAELQATQKQLIQAEKMASLGELTAGIAHEIQNPLNFVNNFSEVNAELIGELKSELATGNMQLANEIADDIKNNQEKIIQHGKRADSIVKGMLQHSRSSNGVKEPTDINALADEYVRLAYHGLRAKDKTFNATLKTEFDATIGTVNIVPQDIGRVIVNLVNNAFYAVASKEDPIVSISTRKTNNTIEIRVQDNGSGIPPNVLDKVFQPFFTTKPAGQGTGLGLSLSYDIVKAHGGELKVETKQGEGTVFYMLLPQNPGS